MPRRTHIRLVGKLAVREAEALAYELTALEGELHAEWRRLAEEAAGVRPVPVEGSEEVFGL